MIKRAYQAAANGLRHLYDMCIYGYDRGENVFIGSDGRVIPLREVVASCKDSKPEDLLAFPEEFARIMSEIYNPAQKQESSQQQRKTAFVTASGLILKIDDKNN